MTRSLQIVIEMGNAAFDGDACGAEVARILESLASDARHTDMTASAGQLALWDVNGNRVGYAEIIEENGQ